MVFIESRAVNVEVPMYILKQGFEETTLVEQVVKGVLGIPTPAVYF
jgi:hypothetical protein